MSAVRHCAQPGCGTRLSRYNDGDHCALHEPPEKPDRQIAGFRAAPLPRRAPPPRGDRLTREVWELALARLAEARDFASTIASAWGYSYDELRAPGRRDELVTLRARLAHHFRAQGFTLTAIGGLLGRNHTTVMNMLRMDVPR